MTDDPLVHIDTLAKRLLHAMRLDLSSTACVVEGGFRVDLTGADSLLLLQRKAEALDAIQLFFNLAFHDKLGPERRITIDCGGYRRGKETELRRIAFRLAERAKVTGEPQEMGPLNPYDRRLVHLALADDSAVSTSSRGTDFLKVIVITPGKR